MAQHANRLSHACSVFGSGLLGAFFILIVTTGLQHGDLRGGLTFSVSMVAFEMCIVYSRVYYVTSCSWVLIWLQSILEHMLSSFVYCFPKSYCRVVLCILCFSTFFIEASGSNFLSDTLTCISLQGGVTRRHRVICSCWTTASGFPFCMPYCLSSGNDAW